LLAAQEMLLDHVQHIILIFRLTILGTTFPEPLNHFLLVVSLASPAHNVVSKAIETPFFLIKITSFGLLRIPRE